jgi:hypothetical protein
MQLTRTRKIAVAGVLTLSTAGLVGASLTSSNASDQERAAEGTTTAKVGPLNNSGAHGRAEVVVSGNDLQVVVQVRRLLKDMPHAQHIHFGAKARHECPTVGDDHDHDHRINTAEGIPGYGPVRVSLTTRGDTSPKSTLAVDRFPTAPDHRVSYERTIKVSEKLADKIARGKGVLVIHGVDYNGNGKYDFAGAGKSELDPSLPAEATDPAACGVLKIDDGGGLLD